MTLGKRIKSIRLEKEITQGALAALVETSQKNISTYEVDLVIPSAIMMRKIIIALEADPFYILDIEKKGISDTPLMKLVRKIDSLPEKDKAIVMGIVENFLLVNKIRGGKNKVNLEKKSSLKY
jgi:transcriptional regulator with XRE-family HTH domain